MFDESTRITEDSLHVSVHRPYSLFIGQIELVCMSEKDNVYVFIVCKILLWGAYYSQIDDDANLCIKMDDSLYVSAPTRVHVTSTNH